MAAARVVAIAYDPRSSLHEHPTGISEERPARTEAIYERLEKAGYVQKACKVPARGATDDELLRVHTQKHLDHVESTKHAEVVWWQLTTRPCS